MNIWIERYRTIILASIGVALVAVMSAFVLRFRPPEPIAIEPPRPTATPGPIQVYVSGAVTNPDVYQMASGSLVQDAITLAGGPTGEADLNLLNLAQRLQDGDQIYVPVSGEMPPPPLVSSGPDTVDTTSVVNINTAEQAELETLPGIGPALAGRIIEYRQLNGPFPSVDALEDVSGIGPTTLEDIRDSVSVE